MIFRSLIALAALFAAAPAAAQVVPRINTISYDNMTALEAVPEGRFDAGHTVIVADALGGGMFVKVSTNETALKAADPSKCVFSDPDGNPANGGWVRQVFQNSGRNIVDPKWCRAAADGATNDDDEMQAAFTLATSYGKSIALPCGNYLLSETWGTIAASDWEIRGAGNTCTTLTQTGDVPTLTINTSSAYIFRINLSHFQFLNTHATGLNSPAVFIDADTASITGLRQSNFESLRVRGHSYGFLVEDTGKVNDGAGNISVSVHAYNVFNRIEAPQYTRYPLSVVRFLGGSGVDNIVSNCQCRATEYAVRAGSGAADVSVGDFAVVNSRFVLGLAAVKLLGPSNAAYKSSVTMTGNQWDVQTNNTFDIENLEAVHIWGNSTQFGVTPRIVNVDLSRSVIETPTGTTVFGLTTAYAASVVNRVQITGAAAAGEPSVLAVGTDANQSIQIGGQGTGGAKFPTNRQNYLFAAGGNNDDSSFTAGASLVTLSPNGADTLIDFRLGTKANATSLILQDSGAKALGFFNDAGIVRPTITEKTLGNPAVIDLLAKLGAASGFGLITDSSTNTEADRILANTNCSGTYTVAASNTAEDVLSVAGVVIPVDGSYLVTATMGVRHLDTLSSDYSMRVLRDSTALDVHDHATWIDHAASNDDFKLFGSRVLWIAAGTYTFKMQIVQNPRTTNGAQIFANSTSARACYLQVVRI